VRATGGLDDTVIDYDERTRTGTGFKFGEPTGLALVSGLKRAASLYKHRDALAALSAQVMKVDHGWAVSARRYLQHYEQIAAARRDRAA
jgi:starch synthase